MGGNVDLTVFPLSILKTKYIVMIPVVDIVGVGVVRISIVEAVPEIYVVTHTRVRRRWNDYGCQNVQR